ncbi:MAG: DUF2851 family protein [Salinimicrobium sediminis]|nr:DUF2851 family protein [Salinimicrobium sediminis]
MTWNISYFYFMREDYLHYLWRYQKLDHQEMRTADGLHVKVISPGAHNLLSGPDFFNSRVLIGDQEWAGNVEIHLRSSDWYMHSHESDPAYDNVILHVVWVHDVEVFRKDNTSLPVVEICHLVAPETVNSYEDLCSNNGNRWINCQNDFGEVDDFFLNNWLERLYVERLEKKSLLIKHIFENLAGDWEAVLFKMLAKNFGLNINGDAFLSVAASIPFSVVRKLRGNRLQLEAIFLGQAGLLSGDCEEPYFLSLKEEYNYLRKKFGLNAQGVLPVKYFRLRPDNFPEVRLAQLAGIYNKHASLFNVLINCAQAKDLYKLLEVEVNDFWKTHYTFYKSHSPKRKALSTNFMDLLIINTVVPLKFCYARSKGKEEGWEEFSMIEAVAPEENQVIKKFSSLRPQVAENALRSQALLQLKNEYCDKNACLSCAIGVKLLQREPQF